ncbi:hypothetical protein [Bartonella florencae]|uniref:hypothetical protein n=1 Tax=Bartonella florencae TaxID=928210 RepID=UPI0012EAF437|nr:hypothetical protein [Bartonella florencae]
MCSTSLGNLAQKGNSLIHEACATLNNHVKVATFPPINALSAVICANDAVKFWKGYSNLLSTDHHVEIWDSQLFAEKRSLTKNLHCHIFGTLQ